MNKKFLILIIFCVTIMRAVNVTSMENNQLKKYLNYIDEKVIYLTFDDGPSPNTEKILNVLKEEDVKATFFVIGNQLDSHKNTVIKLQQAGMCILPHTDTHNYRKIYKTSEAYFEDLNTCKDRIKNIISKEPVNFVRFPGGVNNEMLKNDVLKDIKQRFIDEKWYFIEWNVYGLDAEVKPKDSETICRSTINQLKNKNKAIVLLHDGYGNINTANCIKEIIVNAKELGYKFKTLEEITEKDFDYLIKKNVKIKM